MKVPLLDLKAQFKTIEPDIRAAVDRVLQTQGFILGPEVASLESEIAPYVGCKHAVGVSSGSDALIVSLMALGVGPGDEVVTTPYTFFATVGAIARLGARPVFVDIEPRTYNIDPERFEAALSARTKAAIPVHLYGQAAEMDPILRACRARGVAVIEDAAQAIGTEYKGRRIGSLGDLGCFSFFPSKNLGAMGDGGLVSTNDDQLAEKLRVLRGHGSKPKYYHKVIGGNFRLDALQAAIVRTKFTHLDSWSAARTKNADRYDGLFRDAGLEERVRLPYRREGDRHIFNQYVIRVQRRDELMAFLKERGIGTEVYYPLSMHMQECFSYLGHRQGDFPESEAAARETLAIPVYPELTAEQQAYVVETIGRFFGSS